MSRFIKDAAKSAGNLANTAIKTTIAALISDMATDIIKESGATDIAKDKMVEVGMSVFKNLDMDIGNIQREIFKQAMISEFKKLGNK